MAAKLICALLLVLCPCLQASESSLTIAVTASMKPVFVEWVALFTQETGKSVRISSASTGVLFQQSVSGAPFDIFFAADDVRPAALAEQLKLPTENTVHYATGTLVWVSQTDEVTNMSDLANYRGKVILANPAVAPYGEKADVVLMGIGYSGDRVLANNVAQARQYVSLGLAPVALMAESVSQGLDYRKDFPQGEIKLAHDAVLLTDHPDASAFMDFIALPQYVAVWQRYGLEPNLGD